MHNPAVMTRSQRLDAIFVGREPDRTPILGGWIACPDHICALVGTTLKEYWADPKAVSIRAYQALGSDGLIDIFVPKSRADYRGKDIHTYHRAGSDLSLEETVTWVDALPSAQQIESEFDFAAGYASFRNELLEGQARCGEMVWMPAQWTAGAHISWYGEIGYEHFFYIFGADSERALKLLEVGGARAHCRARLIARAVEEGIYPHAVLLGADICTHRGPMISPAYMERFYAPQLSHGLQPLLDVGCKPVWHCDGDVRPILDLLLACGVQGLQGFQPECGLTIEYVTQKRTREGRPLLIFGPLAVTTELPVCTPEEVRARVRHAIEVCRGAADLVMFSSNTINPDVPLANVIAMHEAVGSR
jgi:hypothetical protein